MKSWITVTASEVVTGDVDDIGRVSSVARKGHNRLVLSHNMAKDIEVNADSLYEVYREEYA